MSHSPFSSHWLIWACAKFQILQSFHLSDYNKVQKLFFLGRVFILFSIKVAFAAALKISRTPRPFEHSIYAKASIFRATLTPVVQWTGSWCIVDNASITFASYLKWALVPTKITGVIGNKLRICKIIWKDKIWFWKWNLKFQLLLKHQMPSQAWTLKKRTKVYRKIHKISLFTSRIHLRSAFANVWRELTEKHKSTTSASNRFKM